MICCPCHSLAGCPVHVDFVSHFSVHALISICRCSFSRAMTTFDSHHSSRQTAEGARLSSASFLLDIPKTKKG